MTFTESLKDRWPLIGAIIAVGSFTASFVLSAVFYMNRASSLALWVGLALLATLYGSKGRVGALVSFGLFYLVQIVLSTTMKFSWRADGVIELSTPIQLLLVGASILVAHLLTRKMMVWGEKGSDVIYKTICIEMRMRPAKKNGKGPDDDEADDDADSGNEGGAAEANIRVVAPKPSETTPLPEGPGYVGRERFPD